MGGKKLLEIYGDMASLLNSTIGGDFLPWAFKAVPHNYWKERGNRLRYLNWLKDKVGVKSISDLQKKHFLENFGAGLLVQFQSSPHAIVASIGPESTLPKGTKKFYDSTDSQKRFAESLAVKLNFDPLDFEKWYNVKTKDVYEHGGKHFLGKHYGYSLYRFLKSIYPSFDWKPWKFKSISKDLLEDPSVLKEVASFAEKEFSISDPADWHRVRPIDIKRAGLHRFIQIKDGVVTSPPSKSNGV
jgi:hypothetical protein